MAKHETIFSKDPEGSKLRVTRNFNAELQPVWQAWTDASVLDQWWAPKPYRAVTLEMDFREGGHWRYDMVGPQGDRHCCKVNYTSIKAMASIHSTAMFCDEAGNENTAFPRMHWKQEFLSDGDLVTVNVEISFDSGEAMEQYLKMGFQEGFTMGLANLDTYLAAEA